MINAEKRQKALRLRSYLKSFDLYSIYKELSLELEVLDFSGLDLLDLHSKAILARVLTSIGCHDTALTVIEKVGVELKARFDQNDPDVLYIYSIGSSVYFHAYHFHEALQWVNCDVPDTGHDLYGSHRLRYFLYSAFIKKSFDDRDEAEFMKYYQAGLYDTFSKCTFLIQELMIKSWFHQDSGLKNSLRKIELIKTWDLPHFIHKYHLFMAKVHWDNENITTAQSEIKKAQKLCSPFNLNAYLEILFFKYQMDETSLLPMEKLLLSSSMTHSPYSYLFGNRYREHHPLEKDLIKSRYIKKSPDVSKTADAWLIKKEGLLPVSYVDVSVDDNIIDLVSGAMIVKGELSWLSRNRAVCLMCIISGAHVGVPEELIAEKVYREDQSLFTSVRGRLRDLVTQLINSGIVIKRSHRLYLYDFEKNPFTIIFPRNHQFGDKFLYLKKQIRIINTEQVARILNIKSRTASEFIKSWKEEKLIAPAPTGKYGDYEILP